MIPANRARRTPETPDRPDRPPRRQRLGRQGSPIGFSTPSRPIPDLPDLPQIEPAVMFTTLSASIPLLMLPIRLETRFYENPKRLRIRIFPDQIHVNSHQDALSPKEAQLGRRFWEIAWKTGWERGKRVFKRLADTLGVWRAAWVMEVTTPANLSAFGKGEPIFPKVNESKQPEAPAIIELLPNRWFVAGFLNNEAVLLEYGEPIPRGLHFAPFQMQGTEDADRWLADFEAAKRVGMALEIALDGDKRVIADAGLDELIVVGARLDEPSALAEMLEDTLRGHYYARGFDFVPQGTPTNNTESVRSPWQWDSADSDLVFERTWEPAPPIAESYRERFASALGLSVDGISARALHGDVVDIPGMEAMNRALWYVMWGEYLRFMLSTDGKSLLSAETLNWLRDQFVTRVRGGAAYPAFHLGSVPYGILPIQMQPIPKNAQSEDQYLQLVLWNLRAGWERSLPNVPHLDPTAVASAGDAPVETDLQQANENLIALLSSHPHPASAYIRSADNLRTMPFWSILFDPVDLYEGQKDALVSKLRALDLGWAHDFEADLETPFASLAEQEDYFEDMIAEFDDRIEPLKQRIQDIGNAYGGVLPVEAAEQVLALQDSVAEHEAAKQVAENIVMLLNAHAQRVAPHNALGLPPVTDALSAETVNVDQFYFVYAAEDTVTPWGALPFVQAADAVDGGTAAVYLPWLEDYAQGIAGESAPPGLPDPAPLLYQLIKQAIDRAAEWDDAALFELDGILVELGELGGLASAAERMSRLRGIEQDQARITSATNLLASALNARAADPIRTAIAAVPRPVFKNAADSLRGYVRAMKRSAPALERLIGALDQWSALPSTARTAAPTPTINRMSGLPNYIPTKKGTHTAQIMQAIRILATLTPDVLALRMQETLGLAMHRLDAWITAHAENRLQALRAKQPNAVQIGGFGWVENLRPDAAGTSSSQGYIHAPSMTQAAAAAVLRSGYSAYSDGTRTSPLSVDLRSDRVRVASWMMGGVRQGQRVNDLLGYRFERFLHDARLDIWIDPVREVVKEHGTTELSNSRRKVIVDGLALLELWDEGRGALQRLIPSITDSNGTIHLFNEIVPALRSLVWTTDSMADLVVAESVHALVQGDYERASAVYAASALGDVAPPEVRSVLTPNSGMTITHRVVILPQATETTWGAAPWSVRRRLEPALEAWAADMIGDPARIRFSVTTPGGEAQTGSLADLPLSALDAVYLSPSSGASLTGSPLGSLVLAQCCLAFGSSDGVVISADAQVEASDITLADFLLLAERLRVVLSNGRPASASDFVLGGAEPTAGVNFANLSRRVETLVNGFSGAVAGVEAPAGTLFEALLRLSYFNLPQAIPTTLDETLLAAQAAALLPVTQKRRDDAQAAWASLQASLSTASAEQNLRAALDLVALVVGRDFPLMPRFSMANTSAVAQDEATIDGSSPAPVTGWMLKVARVHADLAALRDLITTAEALRDETLFTFSVIQQPLVAGEAWVGLSRPNETGADRLSVVVTTNGSTGTLPAELGGLVIDQWTERIPTDYEMTGLAVHFDAPTSRPPQTLLLAMPPLDSGWNLDAVVNVVREAFAMARVRAVAPETLGEYGHQVPAVYLTVKPDTIGAEENAE